LSLLTRFLGTIYTKAVTLPEGSKTKRKDREDRPAFNEIVTAINRVEESVEAEVGR